MNADRRFELPVRIEAVAFVVIVTTALLLRINQLSADPPMSLSLSQGIYTDPAAYTSFARNLVLWGTLNPLHDFRLIFLLKSAMTLISYPVFEIAGVGYVQSSIAGLIFSFPTIILLYFAVRKAAGNLAAFFFLIFISLDYNQIFYGRLPFLENSMNFFGVLTFTILIYGKRAYALLLAGVFLGLAIFFGKIIGVIYLFPFACFAVYEYFHGYRPNLKKLLARYLFLAIGLLAVLIFWYFFSYRPMAESVTGYIQDHAFNLYGTPEALTSFNSLVYKYVSFGEDSRLFIRMLVPALLAWAMILVFLYRTGFKESWKNRLFGITPGVLFLIALVIAAYGALMIWNYRPLRYQTMLIYPICALAGVFVSSLIHGFKTPLNGRQYMPFAVMLFVFSLVPIYQMMGSVYSMLGLPFYFEESKSILLILAFIIIIAIVVFMRFAHLSFRTPPRLWRDLIILAAVILALVPNGFRYLRWNSSATYNTIMNSRDLSTILSAEAVVSGPYAPAFTQNNNIMNLIHTFGVASADPAFFMKFPITHLLLDKTNVRYAKKHYSGVMEKAVPIVNYRIGRGQVTLYRVAESTGNVIAGGYRLSAFETALHLYSQERVADGNEFMKLHLIKHPHNLTANVASGTIAYDNGFYDEAEYYFEKAIEFSPTDFHLRFKLGEFYINMYKKMKDSDLRDKALVQFDLAKKYNPDSQRLTREIDDLLSEEDSADIE